MNVLFVCIQNAGRSQMAEALFALLAGDRHASRSAGSAPADRVHPEVVEALGEVGVDVSGRTPRALEATDADWADVVVSMGCGDACPIVPNTRYLEWDLPDPSGRSLAEVRAIRDEIDRRVQTLLGEVEAGGTP